GVFATVRYPWSSAAVVMVSRCAVINSALVSGSRTSMPESSVTCAYHDDPPNVGDSTNAETASRPLLRIASSSEARASATADENCGRSNTTAPYDSMKNSRTSDPATRDKSASNEGLAGSDGAPCIADTTNCTCLPYVCVTGTGNIARNRVFADKRCAA